MSTSEDYPNGGRFNLDGRTLHYGHFYGVVDPPEGDDRPVLVVWGNCQAEALRIVLSSSVDLPYRTVRVPPVHELTPSDMPSVDRLLGSAAVVVSQPVRSGYRGLPIGTQDLLERPDPPSTLLVWPVVRYGGLYPFQAIVRHPGSPSASPPGVPYHDLRTIVGVARGSAHQWDVHLSSDRVRAAADWSIDQLAVRERRDCDVAVSDILLGLGDRAAHTINHPGNDVLLTLGHRILDSLGASGPTDPGRELLGNIRTPLEADVVEGLGLDAQTRADWQVGDAAVSQQEIVAVQSRWYGEHPEYIDAALARYGELVDILGMAP